MSGMSPKSRVILDVAMDPANASMTLADVGRYCDCSGAWVRNLLKRAKLTRPSVARTPVMPTARQVRAARNRVLARVGRMLCAACETETAIDRSRRCPECERTRRRNFQRPGSPE